jgi:hypothetical protein
MIRIALILISLLSAAPLAAASLDGNEILRKVDRNLEPESYEMYRKLINIEPSGAKKEFVLYSVKSGRDKMLALFLEPASDKGRTTLRLGENMWLYIPNVGKPVRITNLQSVIGGVFNNADILRLDYAVEYDAKIEEEQKDTLVLMLKIEAYAASGMLIKTLHFKDIKDFGGGIRRPAVVETDSPLFKGYVSVMLYSGIKKRLAADELFTLTNMHRVEELRR